MRTRSTLSLITFFFVGTAIFSSCSVDTKGLVFDDDAFDRLENTTNGDGDGGSTSESGDGDSSTSGDGDGDSSTSGDGDSSTSGDGDGDGGAPGTTGDVEPECMMIGEMRCDDEQVQVCSGEFFIDAGEPCEFVCEDGACTGTCPPGETECVSETEQRSCNTSGQWGEASQCSNVCVGDACGGECKPGDRSCDETNSQMKLVCNAAGEWVEDGACSTGDCSDGVCTACAGTETQCTADSKAVQICESGTFGSPEECLDQVCVDGACTGECRPALGGDEPYRKCVPGSPSIQLGTCGADGMFGNPTNCNFVCVEGSEPGKNDACGGVCKPGEQRCDGDGVLYRCAADGMSEEKVEDCSEKGESCLPISANGELGCGVCTPGSSKAPNARCKQRYVETCVGGQWEQAQNPCPSGIGKSAVGLCWDGECTTNGEVCSDTRGGAFGCYDSSTPWGCDGSSFDTGSCKLLSTCTYTKCTSGGISR